MKSDPPARLFRRAHLLAPDEAPPGHDALATVGEHIVAVGPEDVCRAALPESHVVVDLAGRTLAPGFVDAHLHPLVMCVFEQHLVLDRVRSLADVLDAVADRARATPPDEAVVAFQLDDARLVEHRLPTAAELEAAAPRRAVVLVRRDGHHAVGSTTALRAAGLDGGAPPLGGHVERDAAGHLTGLVGETAVAPLLGLLPEVSLESLAAGARSWSARLLRQGVTGITAICQTTAEGPSGPAGELEALGWSTLTPDLVFDVQTVLVAPDLEAVADLQAVPALHDPARRRRVDAVKLFLDGTLGGATACMHEPFADRRDTAGMRTMGDDEALRRLEAAHCAGLQVCVHAIGDRANRAAADLFARVLARHPGPHRHRVEHASVLDQHTVESFAAHGITCVVQPVNLRSEAHWLAGRLGPDRLGRAYPFRRMLDAGIEVAGSSDAPIESTDVLAAMAASVQRRGLADEQALSPVEALGLYTTGANHARQTDQDAGRLLAGARADLVVLSDDLVTTPDVASVDVLGTCIAGTFHHVHPDLASVVGPSIEAQP